MKESSTRLYQSLVGCSTEFRFGLGQGAVSVEDNIRTEREIISRDVEQALYAGGKLCIMLLAEITNYYRNMPHYMALRSAIEMRRYRPKVLEYLSLPVQERSDRLHSVLSERITGDKYRELKVTITRYFLKTYPNRLADFKGVLTREEFMLVA